MQGDLTRLATVREWLAPGTGTVGTGGDALLERLITSASRFVLNHIGRDSLAIAEYDEWLDSGGQNFILLRQWPVLSVTSIAFDGLSITDTATGNPPASGYLLESPAPSGGQQRLSIYPHKFPRGRSSVRVVYTAGYRTSETLTVPATPYKLSTSLCWLDNVSVTRDGTLMTEVASGPITGQYSVSADGEYTFAAADTGDAVVIVYSYVPSDIEQAVVELVGERVKSRERIGVSSKSLPNGESVSFMTKDMSTWVKTTLQAYRRVTPA